MTDSPSKSAEFEQTRYRDGIRLFNAGDFFEAHEAWEDVWRNAHGMKRSYYQGLIQCAVAVEHYRRSNPRGVRSLFESYRKHFAVVPEVFMGLDVADFLRRMREILRPVVEADPLPPRGGITLDPELVPKIALLYNPFENGEAEKYDGPLAGPVAGK